MADQPDNVTLQGVRLIFRNFEGKEDKYNREGNRNFNVILPADLAAQMAADGWVIRTLPARPDDEGAEDMFLLPVALRFDVFPPRIITISSSARTQITEKTCASLDWVDIKDCDLTIRPYHWFVGEKDGIKAYLKTMFLTIDEDELERKYAISEHPPAGNND